MKIPLLFAVILLLGASACQSNSDQDNYPAPPFDERFQTIAPEQLYFKNIRSSSYALTEVAATKVNIYRLRQWPKMAEAPFVGLSIVDNWLHDQAYLSIDWIGVQPELPVTILTDKQQIITLENQQWGSQQAFALSIYEQLMAGHQLSWQETDSTSVIVLADEQARTAFRVTMKDYLKLTSQ